MSIERRGWDAVALWCRRNFAFYCGTCSSCCFRRTAMPRLADQEADDDWAAGTEAEEKAIAMGRRVPAAGIATQRLMRYSSVNGGVGAAGASSAAAAHDNIDVTGGCAVNSGSDGKNCSSSSNLRHLDIDVTIANDDQYQDSAMISRSRSCSRSRSNSSEYSPQRRRDADGSAEQQRSLVRSDDHEDDFFADERDGEDEEEDDDGNVEVTIVL